MYRPFNEFFPDLIFSDYGLTQHCGELALVEAKRLCPEVPFVLVTGAFDREEEPITQIIARGASGYITPLISLQQQSKKPSGQTSAHKNASGMNPVENGGGSCHVYGMNLQQKLHELFLRCFLYFGQPDEDPVVVK